MTDIHVLSVLVFALMALPLWVADEGETILHSATVFDQTLAKVR